MQGLAAANAQFRKAVRYCGAGSNSTRSSVRGRHDTGEAKHDYLSNHRDPTPDTQGGFVRWPANIPTGGETDPLAGVLRSCRRSCSEFFQKDHVKITLPGHGPTTNKEACRHDPARTSGMGYDRGTVGPPCSAFPKWVLRPWASCFGVFTLFSVNRLSAPTARGFFEKG